MITANEQVFIANEQVFIANEQVLSERRLFWLKFV